MRRTCLPGRVDLEAPLAEYRIGQADSGDDLERLLDRQGVLDATVWRRGGPPVAVTPNELFLVDEGDVYRIERDQVVGLGQTRATDHSLMRWGAALYLFSLPLMFLQIIPGGLLLAVLMAIAGGGLVTVGFLSKALLIQVDDDRIPPFVVDHRKWKRIHASIQDWA